ncbi:hypothetical protein DFQ04_2350 [Algoriphagus boseongensis]|uniref:Uncharacterized protein n=1 Tax=Algoriphagus boseongensis TaxID=1442587 RepID=A0A4R6T5P8_9BACT|nr:hypothetical protein [Algoriphagus boseongensis]TDQ16238.1 hypothetical protein DFQ04_2350 [Algoriphagus boseongensis]
MKAFALFFLLIICTGIINPLFAQENPNKILAEELLAQSEKQKKTGWTFIGVGAATTGLGTLLMINSDDWGSTGFGTGVVLFVGGGAMMVIGIPILIGSTSKARKAAKLSLGTEIVKAIHPNMNLSSKSIPTVTFSIPLNH